MTSDAAQSAGPEYGAWRRSHRAPRFKTGHPPGRLTVLSIVHAGEGGTILTNEDLMRALARMGHTCFILSCGPGKWVLETVREDKVARAEEVKFQADWRTWEAPRADRVSALDDLLKRLSPQIVHIRSFLGCGPEAARQAARAGAGIVVSYHDYAAVCPNIQLLDASLTHCAGRCTVSSLECAAPAKWFEGMGRLKHAYVHTWRERVSAAFRSAACHVTTSPAAASLLKRRLKHLRTAWVDVVEHGRDDRPFAAARIPRPGAPTDIVALGAASDAKGRGLLQALIARNRAAGGPFRFHLVGARDAAGLDDPYVTMHEHYAREDLPAILRRIGPSLSLIASPWPETFSHTLTESWLAGAPALVSDLGAPAARVRKHGGGWRLDPHDPEAWWAAMTRANADPLLWARKSYEIARMQFRDTAAMARDYQRLYTRTLRLAKIRRMFTLSRHGN